MISVLFEINRKKLLKGAALAAGIGAAALLGKKIYDDDLPKRKFGPSDEPESEKDKYEKTIQDDKETNRLTRYYRGHPHEKAIKEVLRGLPEQDKKNILGVNLHLGTIPGSERIIDKETLKPTPEALKGYYTKYKFPFNDELKGKIDAMGGGLHSSDQTKHIIGHEIAHHLYKGELPKPGQENDFEEYKRSKHEYFANKAANVADETDEYGRPFKLGQAADYAERLLNKTSKSELDTKGPEEYAKFFRKLRGKAPDLEQDREEYFKRYRKK